MENNISQKWQICPLCKGKRDTFNGFKCELCLDYKIIGMKTGFPPRNYHIEYKSSDTFNYFSDSDRILRYFLSKEEREAKKSKEQNNNNFEGG